MFEVEIYKDMNQGVPFYFYVYNQTTTKLAFHSNETSKDKLSII